MKRILGFIGWVGVACVVASVAIRFGKPEYVRLSQSLAIAGLVTTALYALSQWRDVAQSLKGKNVKYGSAAASGVLLVLAILIGVNWISSRQNKRWDLTAASQFSLADQTKKILADLKKPVKATVFFAKDAPTQEFRDRLTEYGYYSKQITSEFVDAMREPARAQTAGITMVPTLVLEYEGRTEKVNSSDEQTVTNALKKVLTGTAKKVYFLEGHGERDTASSDKEGYSSIVAALKNDNFEVAKLSLAQEGKIPADATVLVLAGPTRDLVGGEAGALGAYMKAGGKLLMTIDPPERNADTDPASILALARDWGINVGHDLLIDVSPLGQQAGTGPMMPIATALPHPITRDFGGLYSAFPVARSVTPIEGGASGRMAQKFLQTSPQSWGETDLKALFSGKNAEVSRDLDKGDEAGPVSLAVAVSAPVADAPGAAPDAPKPESRMVVIGDSDFASNAAIRFSGNQDLYLNVVNWLAQQEDLIAIRPKNPQDRPLTVTADQERLIAWFVLLIMPGLLFANGVRIWWRRR